MSDSIETLLVRNLHEVFGERDPARRASAIEAIFDRDCLFSDPRGRHVGHRGLEDAVVALQAQFPAMAFRRSAELTPCKTADGSPGRSGRRTNRTGSPDWTLSS
jgi:hypothetical protein